ncbi:MAG TPA: protein jag, partial [Sulfurimonas autotrophica]|nr:protein jag [Sulfurimonas autotrophica]
FLGLFKKPAIIVAAIDKSKMAETKKETSVKTAKKSQEKEPEIEPAPTFLNDTILPTSFVSDQDEELEEDLASGLDYTADYDDAFDEDNIEAAEEVSIDIDAVANEVQKEINDLFKLICFEIDTIEVTPYDRETLLIEFKGEDAALLIGKEGYRYKALSYMLFNWINTKYNVQLRLEIAEFLKNQEESVGRYLTSVCENIDRDGRAQTKILDGVLVQIALKELRERYPEKYVVIRSTRDGLKYILVNDYHTN